MRKDIEDYCRSCDDCQRRGGPKRNNHLHPIEPTNIFERWGIDIMGPLPVTERGNRYIVVATDYFTRWPEAKPLKNATAKAVADFIYEEIICRFGPPTEIQSDQGSHFRNEMIVALMDKFRIKHRLSSPYHPQSNGLVERFNRTLGDALGKICDTVFDWDLFIQPILFAYRTKPLSVSKHSPFELVYGKLPTLIMDQPNRDKQTMIDRMIDLIDKVPQLRQSAKRAIVNAQRKLAQNYHVKAPKEFHVGQQVLYYDKAKAMQHHTKLEPKWKGPYSIYAVLPKGAYRIADHMGVLKSHVNGDLLKKYNSRESWEPIVLVNLIY